MYQSPVFRNRELWQFLLIAKDVNILVFNRAYRLVHLKKCFFVVVNEKRGVRMQQQLEYRLYFDHLHLWQGRACTENNNA